MSTVAERLDPPEHVVHFYRQDADLSEAVVSYLAEAMAAGSSTVLFATPAHCELFLAGLGVAGIDCDLAISDERLMIMDATETLSRIMADGHPDADAFDAVVGALVRRASAQRPRAYGEMVALLWEAGDVTSALELEELWSDLAARRPVSVFCAYPSQLMDLPEAANAFADVCSRHSRVVAGAPVPPDAEMTMRFARHREAPRLARKFVTDAVAEWDLDDCLDASRLVVSELATNALQHAQSDFSVSLSHVPNGIKVTVGDRSSDPPHRRTPAPTIVGGRGLQVVARLAHRWGHLSSSGGKLVWVELVALGPEALSR